MIQRHIENLNYGTILNKPNQIISLNRVGLTDLQSASLDVFIHEYQTAIFLLEQNGKDYTPLLDEAMEIPLNEFIQKVKGDNYKLKDCSWLRVQFSNLLNFRFENTTPYSFKGLNMFQILEYDEKTNLVKFQLTNAVVKGLAKDSKIIGDFEEEHDAYYTSYNYANVNAYDLTSHERGLYENVLQHMWHLYKYERNSMVCDIKEFLNLIGIESENQNYYKRKINIIIENIEKKTGMKLQHEYITGKYKKVIKIKIRILEFEGSKNKEIVDFLKSDNAEKHEYKLNKQMEELL